jgi:V/A-type H+-transporting ATPase subunit B
VSAPIRIYRGASAAGGPLVYLPDARGAVLGEWVTLDAPGQPPRRGQVIEVGTELTVVQLLEESHGLAPASTRVVLTGELAGTPVGREMLGRVLDGAGNPLDGLPRPVGEAWKAVWGAPVNPACRARPAEVIETGISAIDGLNTLVRGQKLPVFSGPGLPALDLASRVVEGARVPGGEPFAVVFVAIGITERETRAFLDRFENREALEHTVVYLNRTGDPTLERLLAPRLALTVAEYLAFEAGLHVLVVMADITHYCEALREIAAYREEIPGRRGYPGYMYTDLATLFERAGILREAGGSLTQLPILTMPDDDITHPIPDLTGYITEGQIVLGRDLHRRGVSPPVDVLPSLSRLMKAGIGQGRTAPYHRAWADQIYALYAQGREARLTAAIVGETGLSEADRRAVEFAARFEAEFVNQAAGRRSFEETFRVGWALLEMMPREELLRIDDETWAARPGVAEGS